MRAQREQRTGRRRDINVGGSPEAVTRRYQTLWYDHGSAPTAGAYRYVLLSGATAAQTAARSTALPGWLSVLSNRPWRRASRCPASA